jgi:hypothetical protein
VAVSTEKTMTKSSKEEGGAIIFSFDLIDAPFRTGDSY